jgi:hypothetical protein
VTISTAPVNASRAEGEGVEQRGGFQICPAWHNARTNEAGAPMILTIGPPGKRRRDMEGAPPLFRDFVTLDNDGGKTEISVDDGSFEPMPQIIGNRRDAFTGPGLTSVFQSLGLPRAATKGVTAFRITLPNVGTERAVIAANAAVVAYRQTRLAAARAGKTLIVSGVLNVNANPSGATNVSYVRFSVEGMPRGLTNVSPFIIPWDTTRVPDGDYLLQADALDTGGTVIATTRRRVYVLNATATRSKTAMAGVIKTPARKERPAD